MSHFIIRIIGNAVALYVAVLYVPGFVVSGSIWHYALAGLLLAILNMTIGPILKAISFPLILLSLGLFTIVINALLLWILDYLMASVTIQNLTALVWATIVVGVVNIIVSMIAKVV